MSIKGKNITAPSFQPSANFLKLSAVVRHQLKMAIFGRVQFPGVTSADLDNDLGMSVRKIDFQKMQLRPLPLIWCLLAPLLLQPVLASGKWVSLKLTFVLVKTAKA